MSCLFCGCAFTPRMRRGILIPRSRNPGGIVAHPPFYRIDQVTFFWLVSRFVKVAGLCLRGVYPLWTHLVRPKTLIMEGSLISFHWRSMCPHTQKARIRLTAGQGLCPHLQSASGSIATKTSKVWSPLGNSVCYLGCKIW